MSGDLTRRQDQSNLLLSSIKLKVTNDNCYENGIKGLVFDDFCQYIASLVRDASGRDVYKNKSNYCNATYFTAQDVATLVKVANVPKETNRWTIQDEEKFLSILNNHLLHMSDVSKTNLCCTIPRLQTTDPKQKLRISSLSQSQNHPIIERFTPLTTIVIDSRDNISSVMNPFLVLVSHPKLDSQMKYKWRLKEIYASFLNQDEYYVLYVDSKKAATFSKQDNSKNVLLEANVTALTFPNTGVIPMSFHIKSQNQTVTIRKEDVVLFIFEVL